METLAGLPESFSLEGNYPNLFSGQTTIAFQVAEKEKVTLEVYDLLGRKVAMLVDEELAPGTYKLEWSAHGLLSGPGGSSLLFLSERPLRLSSPSATIR